MGNINGEKFRMNYINVNHLVRFYDDEFYAPVTGAALTPPADGEVLGGVTLSPI